MLADPSTVGPHRRDAVDRTEVHNGSSTILWDTDVELPPVPAALDPWFLDARRHRLGSERDLDPPIEGHLRRVVTNAGGAEGELPAAVDRGEATS